MNEAELLVYATIGMTIMIGLMGVYAVHMYLYPYSSTIYAFVKTPMGWQLRRLKLTKDNKLRLGKTEFSNWSWDKAVDLQIRRFGMTKWVKAFYVDPDAAVILDPNAPNTIDTLTAKKSMVVSQLLTTLAVNRRREQLLLASIMVIVVTMTAVIGFIVYNSNQTMVEIANSMNTVVTYLNQTGPPLVRP